MSDTAIRAQNLGKLYRIGSLEPYKTLRKTLADVMYAPIHAVASTLNGHRKVVSRTESNNTIWALKDVSFEIKKGEVIGIIGRNGAGKTTLLKILSRITHPTAGSAEIYGRTGSLLEVGTGFHPELTGWENIYLNGAILGMKKAEIHRKFDEIVDFSGVERFIDTPVKHYSSGMYMRLAFAVAAHLEPEILIVDEVLAVGDVGFQEKCLGKMAAVAGSGRTVLFVSHNMSAISSLCPISIWFESGQILFRGRTSEAISQYVDTIRMGSNQAVSLADRKDRKGSGLFRITQIYLEDADFHRCEAATCGHPVRFILEYMAEGNIQLDDTEINLVFADDHDHRLFSCMSEISCAVLKNLPPRGKLVCTVPELPLLPGRYNLHFSCLVNRQLVDKMLFAGSVIVSEGDFFGTGRSTTNTDYYGSLLVKHKWTAEGVSDN